MGQVRIKGKVLNAENNEPITKASVFLSNTSIGTTSNNEGAFELAVPSGKYDLIVSSIGYETFSQTINTSAATDFLSVKLKVKAPELETVIIEPYEKNGWERWGKFFTENFIGLSAYGSNCKIKNPQVLRFRHSKKNNELTAIAMEPLLIENKDLGYTIQYQMESFSYDFKNHYLVYTGYPFFEPMKGGQMKERKWAQNREAVYSGSMLHFMRSVYRNKISEEGFQVRRLRKVPNSEKQRVKNKFKVTITGNSSTQKYIPDFEKDSSTYYNKIMRQPDFFDVIDTALLNGDSIAYAVDSVTAGLEFPNYLLVVYKNKLAPIEYQRLAPENGQAMLSQLTLIAGRPINIQANGVYYYPVDLLSLGYWAWSEKMATMLPFDYKTGKD
jgi:hypothetical protein